MHSFLLFIDIIITIISTIFCFTFTMSADTLELIFVGTGVSCAIPVIGHVGSFSNCCCEEAASDVLSVNRRNNVSLLFSLCSGSSSHAHKEDEETTWVTAGKGEEFLETELEEVQWRILIDCGKTFRNAYFRVLASRGIRYVDALFITHGHADAMNGIEGLCEVHTAALEGWRREESRAKRQAVEPGRGKDEDGNEILYSAHTDSFLTAPLRSSVWRIPVYLSVKTLQEVKSVLSDSALILESSEDENDTGDGASAFGTLSPLSSLHGAQLCPYLLRDECVSSMTQSSSYLREGGKYGDGSKALPCDFPCYAIPVEHGKNYMSFGYVFGRGTRFKNGLSPLNGMKGDDICSEKREEQEVKLPCPCDDRVSHATAGTNVNGTHGSCVVYLSDISEIPPFAYKFLKKLVQIDILVIDLLAEHESSSPAHTCWDNLWPIFHALHPKKVYCVGMFCSIEHHQGNAVWKEELQKQRKDIQEGLLLGEWDGDAAEKAWKQHFLDSVESIELAYDGMTLRIPA